MGRLLPTREPEAVALSVLSDRGDLVHEVVTGTVAQASASQSSARITRVRALPGRGSAKAHPDKVFRRLNAFLFVVAILAYSIGLVACVYGGPGALHLDQSDTVQPFMIMRDAFRDPSSLTDWYTSAALYAFPDCLLAGLLLMLPVDIRLLPMLYGGIMMAGYAFASALVLCVYARIHWMAAALIATAMMTLLLVGYSPPLKFAASIAYSLVVPFFHTGALLVGLVLVAGLGVVVFSPHDKFHIVVSLALLTFLISLSDAIFLFWFVLPSCCASIVYLGLARTRISSAFALFVGAAIAGIAFDRLTHHLPYGADPSNFAATFRTAKVLSQQSFQSFDWALLLPLALVPFISWRGVVLLVRGARSGRCDRGDLGELLLLSCFLASLFAPILTGKLFAVDRLRYSLPIFLMPYLWIALALTRGMPRPLRPLLPIASAGLLLVAALRGTPGAVAGTHHFASLRQPASCLIANGLSEGYADYWNAKSVMWNSDYRLHLFQFPPMGDVVPHRLNYNTRWFRTNATTGAPIRPNFVNVFRISEEKVLAKFGPPSKKIMCGIYPIWIYDHTLPLLD